jgi:hypothetical protein
MLAGLYADVMAKLCTTITHQGIIDSADMTAATASLIFQRHAYTIAVYVNSTFRQIVIEDNAQSTDA